MWKKWNEKMLSLYDIIYRFFQDKSSVHKLFKVLVPRYQNYTSCYTSLFHAPKRILSWEEFQMPCKLQPKLNLVVVELKGHPYPPLAYSNTQPNRKHIHNVLLLEAKRDMERNKLEID